MLRVNEPRICKAGQQFVNLIWVSSPGTGWCRVCYGQVGPGHRLVPSLFCAKCGAPRGCVATLYFLRALIRTVTLNEYSVLTNLMRLAVHSWAGLVASPVTCRSSWHTNVLQQLNN